MRESRPNWLGKIRRIKWASLCMNICKKNPCSVNFFFPSDLNICMPARSPDALIGEFIYQQLLPMSQPERGHLHSMVQDYFHSFSLLPPSCVRSWSVWENGSFKQLFFPPGVNTYHTFPDAHLLLIRYNGKIAIIMSITTCEKIYTYNYLLIIFLAIWIKALEITYLC